MGSRNKKYKLALLILLAACAVTVFGLLIHRANVTVLNPKGIIAAKERGLLITAVLVMLIAAVPVYFFIFFFAWKYRADKQGAAYSPNSVSGPVSTFFLWAIPVAIIFVLGILNWKSTHDLDPYKFIASDKKPITIQVIALRWKWLFIYPEQNIAAVNLLEIPQGTPISFELTADDAPMNSFWVPQLGGQMYAMAGMETHLHLIANETGEFNGGAAEINGQGFAGMRFVTKSVSQSDFNAWVLSAKQSTNPLDLAVYNKLAEPSENSPKIIYSSVEKDLQNSVLMKYMAPAPTAPTSSPILMPGMQMK